ncbi:MAG: hypothetical protein EZS28_051714, partial [Streblomastix strix]
MILVQKGFVQYFRKVFDEEEFMQLVQELAQFISGITQASIRLRAAVSERRRKRISTEKSIPTTPMSRNAVI